MSRVRFMSPYLKGGRDTAKLTNRARYIATRPGVEVLRGEHSGQPATKKQQAYIQRLLRDFPGAEELLEYEDYQNAPTQGHANAFIRQVQEDFAEPMSRMENYLDYVSHRPGVQMDGEHGLWCAGGKVRNLSQAVREVAEQFGCTVPIFGMVKDDRHRTRALVTPEGREIGIVNDQAVFSLVGQIQEETHRFAITYHHQHHTKSAMRSALDGVPGLGPKRQAELRKHFGTVKAIREADETALAAVLPQNVAHTLWIRLHEKEST